LVGIAWPPYHACSRITSTEAAGVADRTINQPEGVHVMKSFTLITTALVLGASILCVANAAPPSDLPTTVVKFGDLDATGPAGKEELYRRLTRAAHSVCRSLDPSESATKLQFAPLYKTCIDQAVSGAVAKINRREFTEYVASRMQKPDPVGIQLAAR
jgi:UrcA family protein